MLFTYDGVRDGVRGGGREGGGVWQEVGNIDFSCLHRFVFSLRFKQGLLSLLVVMVMVMVTVVACVVRKCVVCSKVRKGCDRHLGIILHTFQHVCVAMLVMGLSSISVCLSNAWDEQGVTVGHVFSCAGPVAVCFQSMFVVSRVIKMVIERSETVRSQEKWFQHEFPNVLGC